MDELQLKIEFAKNYLRHNRNGFDAAFATVPTKSPGVALQMGRDWPKDPVVLVELERLMQGSEAKSFLPTKEKQAQDIYAIATSERVSVDEKLKAHRLYAEMMGHIEKPVPGGNVNILTQGVMIVKDAGSDEEWQEKALAQQRRLIEPSSKPC